MDRCRLAFRSRSASQPTTTFMSPSSIHHLHAELAVAGLCSDITHAVSSAGVAEPAGAAAARGDAARLPALRVQAVEKDGCWFALDSAQLELCRRLERGGVCRQVRVDVVPCRELPVNVRNLIKPPCRLATTTGDSCVAAATPQHTSAAGSSTLPCPVTSSQTTLATAAPSDGHLPTRTSSKRVVLLSVNQSKGILLIVKKQIS